MEFFWEVYSAGVQFLLAAGAVIATFVLPILAGMFIWDKVKEWKAK